MRRTGTIRRRSAFTMIELIVVIGIIVILAGLLLSAIGKVRDTIPRVRTKDEIGQMSLAVEQFKSTYQVPYLPSAMLLAPNYTVYGNSPAALDSRAYFARVWPKATWTGQATPLDGNQCLVFYLGGMSQQGFYNSPNAPFQVPPDGSVARGPFFTFKPERLDLTTMHYHDFYWDGQTSTANVYYYFSSYAGNDYDYFGKKYYGVAPDGSPNPDPVGAQFGGVTRDGGYLGVPNVQGTSMQPFRGIDGRYLNPNGFQIVSAGKDNLVGRGSPCQQWQRPNNAPWPMAICATNNGQPAWMLYDPGIGDYSPGNVGGDDLANFSRSVLSVPD